jgi:Zn finger protein HypA/HybF involved in hydrogenase expression
MKVNCAHCGHELERKPSLVKKSKTGLFFCDRICKQAEQRIGGKLQPDHYGSAKEKHKTWEKRREEKIRKWLDGRWDGSYATGSLSAMVRNYLLEDANYRCKKCGWGEVHVITGVSPLTINHINGNPSDHSYKNLEVLCPNCHSLTENYGGLNKGEGRASRGLPR